MKASRTHCIGSWSRRLVLCVGVCLWLLPSQLTASVDDQLEELRARWEEKSETERRVMRQRFEALQRMSPEQREELRRRAERLRRVEDTLRHQASAEGDPAFEGLNREERAESLRQRVRDHGRKMRRMLPEEVLQRLTDADPSERFRILEEFRSECWKRRGPKSLDRIGKHLGLDEAELQRLRALPEEERMREFLRLRRRLLESRGRPEFVTPENWEAWRELDDFEFTLRIRAAEPRRPDEPGRGHRRGRSRRPENSGPERPGPQGSGSQGSGPEGSGPERSRSERSGAEPAFL